jgi:probable DNA metabolism protein
MILWCYDGTFEGFLSLVHESYIHKTIPDRITSDEPPASLLDERLWIETDEAIARRVGASLRERFSKETLQRIKHAFLCDDSAPERDLLLYIRLGFKSPRSLEDFAHPIVYAIHGYERRLLSTLHKMNAYLRFEELEDKTLYARIAPPRNVLPLMGGHFRTRLRGENFILHDTARSIALLHREGESSLVRVESFETPTLSVEEASFRRLWKTFFDSVAIESRLNPALQRSHVPLKYRTYMSEFID